jgi:hypothetical protein
LGSSVGRTPGPSTPQAKTAIFILSMRTSASPHIELLSALRNAPSVDKFGLVRHRRSAHDKRQAVSFRVLCADHTYPEPGKISLWLSIINAADEIPGRVQSEPDVEALSDALLKEVARVRDVLMPAYQAIGPAGSLVLAMMHADLDRAAEAMIEGDAAAMLGVYELLRGYKE